MTKPSETYADWDVVKSYEIGDTFSVPAKGQDNGTVDFTVENTDKRGRATILSVSGNDADRLGAALQGTWATSAFLTGEKQVGLSYGSRPDSPHHPEEVTLGFNK